MANESPPGRITYVNKCKTFADHVLHFVMYNYWNITAAMVLSIAADAVAFFLSWFEPYSVVCLDYNDAMSFYGLFTLYGMVLLVLTTFVVFVFLFVGLLKSQIVILLFHLSTVAAYYPWLWDSWTKCFPDIQWPRSLSSMTVYKTYNNIQFEFDPIQCTREIKNCYGGYITGYIEVLVISSFIVSFCHTVFFGGNAWRKSRSRITFHTTSSAEPTMTIVPSSPSSDNQASLPQMSEVQIGPSTSKG